MGADSSVPWQLWEGSVSVSGRVCPSERQAQEAWECRGGSHQEGGQLGQERGGGLEESRVLLVEGRRKEG